MQLRKSSPMLDEIRLWAKLEVYRLQPWRSFAKTQEDTSPPSPCLPGLCNVTDPRGIKSIGMFLD